MTSPIQSPSRRQLSAGLALLLGAMLLLAPPTALAGLESRVANTKHNLGSGGPGTVKSTQTSEICVFCHTPHGANTTSVPKDSLGRTLAPLWNRQVAGAGAETYSTSYTMYSSSTADMEILGLRGNEPGGSSKLCLSCHDGVIAVGQVSNAPGNLTSPISVANTAGDGSLSDTGNATGFTRNLGTDLTNDHPISVTYNAALADRDGELRVPDGTQRVTSTLLANGGLYTQDQNFTHVTGLRNSPAGTKPVLKLEPTGTGSVGQVQCATCHEPHLWESNAAKGNQKFLRANRFQETAPAGGNFDLDADQICLGCHDKGGISWAFSAHAHPDVANETYNTSTGTSPGSRREFPANLPVWRAACLNCHDTHTVSGARRLLREGTNEGTLTTGAGKAGGSAALEEVCFQCHDGGTNATLNSVTNVPNIKADFGANRRHPITNAAQTVSPETHEPTANFTDGFGINCGATGTKCGADLLERRTKLSTRHAECTDCHNPHRVIRARNGLPGALAVGNTQDTITGRDVNGGAHLHPGATGVHTNVISGVLRGAWGVEPQYNNNSFHSRPNGFNVKRGDPGDNTAPADPDTVTFVSREYQICLKCHSGFGYGTNVAFTDNPPNLGMATPSGTNSLTQYTDQAKEFQAPSTHAVQRGAANLGADAGSADQAVFGSTRFVNNNHRSWHPVMRPTGRTGRGTNNFLPPWENAGALGVQTMFCSDCHGSSTGNETVVPTNANNASVWGPHGSANNFILKGQWDNESARETTNICRKCHSPANTPFQHGDHVSRVGEIECTWCHVAVPHGWKNRGFLVNLNDVGEEAGHPAGSSFEVAINNNGGNYTQPPYYLQAKLKIRSFPSGNWGAGNCGSVGKTGANLIPNSGGGTGNNTNGGIDGWMTPVCDPPP